MGRFRVECRATGQTAAIGAKRKPMSAVGSFRFCPLNGWMGDRSTWVARCISDSPGGDSHGSTAAASHESVARIAANRRVAVIVPAFPLPQHAPAARA